jgi:hypothetical protein
MNKGLNTYKFISRLKFLRIIFLSFLLIFTANYMSNVFISYQDISSNAYEISKDFESENTEERENERETENESEIEDYDELYLLSFSNLNIDIHFKKVNNLYIFFENSNFKEVDIPPPIC